MTLSPLNIQVAMQRRMLDRIGDTAGLDHKMFAQGAAAATAVSGLLRPAGAFAQAPAAGDPRLAACKTDGAGSTLERLITNAAKFLTYLGLALMILMFAYAGFLIITAGAKKDNQKKGMDAVKNALIGGAIMLLGYATQKVMAAFISGAVGGDGTLGATEACINGIKQ